MLENTFTYWSSYHSIEVFVRFASMFRASRLINFERTVNGSVYVSVYEQYTYTYTVRWTSIWNFSLFRFIIIEHVSWIINYPRYLLKSETYTFLRSFFLSDWMLYFTSMNISTILARKLSEYLKRLIYDFSWSEWFFVKYTNTSIIDNRHKRNVFHSLAERRNLVSQKELKSK